MLAKYSFLEGFDTRLDNAVTVSQVLGAVKDMADIPGLKHAVYYLHDVPKHADKSPIALLTYPDEWISRYYEANYLPVDPVVAEGMRGLIPVDWQKLPRASSKVQSLFGEAIEHGIGSQGVTLTLRGPQGETALFTVTSDLDTKDWNELRKTLLPGLNMAAFLIHQRVMDLAARSPAMKTPHLTPRELDCLLYCAHPSASRLL